MKRDKGSRFRVQGLALAAVLAVPSLLIVPPASAAPVDPLSRPAAAWQPSRPETVKTQVFAALAAGRAEAAARAKAETLWATPPKSAAEDDLLLRIVETYALMDPDAAKLAALCRQPRNQTTAPPQTWLRSSGVPPVFANNLRLFYAQWLVHESLFDEALEQLSGLKPDDVAAPASLLFYQGVVYRALLIGNRDCSPSTNCCKGRTPVRGATSRWPG